MFETTNQQSFLHPPMVTESACTAYTYESGEDYYVPQ